MIGIDRQLSDGAGLTTTLGSENTQLVVVQFGVATQPAFNIPWGPVNLGERWLNDGDPPPPDALTNALGAVDDYLADAEREWRSAGWEFGPTPHVGSVTASGHSVTAMARLESGLDQPPAELEISKADLEEIFRIAATEPRAELAQNPGLARSDAETMISGLCIVAAIARRYRVPAVRFVETAPSRRN